MHPPKLGSCLSGVGAAAALVLVLAVARGAAGEGALPEVDAVAAGGDTRPPTAAPSANRRSNGMRVGTEGGH